MPTYLSAREACAHLPGRPHLNTVRRWMAEGISGVRLRSTRFGGKRLTTAAWCDEFIMAVQAANPETDIGHHRANAILDAFGV